MANLWSRAQLIGHFLLFWTLLRPLIPHMPTTLTVRRYVPMCLAALLAGCYYAPSTTNWHKTQKIVMQVCVPATPSSKAEIIFYRSPPLPSPIGFGFQYSPKGKTIKGQDIFETIFEDPSPLHDAIAVHIVGEATQAFYVFSMPANYSADWSAWANPIAQEGKPITEVDRFKYLRGKNPLEAGVLKAAPKIRARLEFPLDYSASSRSTIRYENIPDCS